MSTVRQQLLRDRFRYERRLHKEKIPIGLRCYLGPEDYTGWYSSAQWFLGDYQWKPSGPRGHVRGAGNEILSFNRETSAGDPFSVKIEDWNQALVDQLHAWQSAGTVLRLYAMAEDWVVGTLGIDIRRRSEVQLEIQFQPFYGCRLIEGMRPEQYGNPFLTGKTYVATHVGTDAMVTSGGAGTASWAIIGEDIIINRAGTENTRTVKTGSAGANVLITTGVTGLSDGDALYTKGQFYGRFP